MIAVVHLVWGPLGVRPVREFVASYREHPAGAEHNLVLLLNAADDELRPALAAELEGVEHRLLELDEPVQDLVAYAQAAARLEHERLCFLNSYSLLLAPDWLAKLSHALDQPGAGLVGATGSWASLHSGVLSSLLLPSPYRGVLPKRKVMREEFYALEVERERGVYESANSGPAPRRSPARSVVNTLKAFHTIPEQILRFQGFPNHHLRTNAFMAERATFASLEIGEVQRKMDAYLLESGRRGLTRQIERRGLRPLVVDRDGEIYEQRRWAESRTLWQGAQEGLLVSDNQTGTYARGGIDRRRVLSAFAWGRQADPTPPGGSP